MEDSFLFKELLCSNFKDDKHVLKEPIRSDCGHFICKSCIPNEKFIKIKCYKCDKLNQNDLEDVKSVAWFEETIDMSLSALYFELEKQTSENISKLKNLMVTREETVEINIKYIEEEVEIRIETLKNELDKLLETFKSKLSNIAIKMKEKSLNCVVNDLKISDYDDKLKEIRNYLENQDKLNKKQFYDHQDALRNLKKVVQQLESNFKDLRLEFTPSCKNVDEEFIGEIYFKSYKPTPKEMKEILEKKPFETIKMNGKYYDNILLNNNFALYTSDFSLDLYDDQFNLIKQITEYDGKEINPVGIACDDEKSKIYISDSRNHRIIMIDFELNFIKSFGYVNGPFDRQFGIIYGLTFSNGYLFVCDYYYEKIQILTSDLQYVDSIKLNLYSYTIKVLNNTMGICSEEGTYFYDLNTKMIKAEYAGEIGRMNLIGSYFYVTSHSPKKAISVYDADGSLIDEINVDRFSNSIKGYWDGHITILEKYILINTDDEKVLKFKIN